jgi:hypothetical protein
MNYQTADLYEAQKGDSCLYLSATNQNLSGHSYRMPGGSLDDNPITRQRAYPIRCVVKSE